MTYIQTAAGLEALDKWAEAQIAKASVWERGAMESFLQTYRENIVEIIGTAILAVPTKEQPK